MKYYIAENGQAVGPFEPSELLARGLTVNSLVWGEGMPSWTSASQVPELMAILTGGTAGVPGNIEVQMPPMPPMGGNVPLPQVPPITTPQPQPIPQPQPTPNTPYGQGGTTQTGNPLPFPQGGPTTTNQPQVASKTWLVESIVATIACSMCCGVPFIGLIPGFVAIYNAFMAKTRLKAGDIAGANKKAASARTWFFITIAVGLAAAGYGAFNTLQNTNITDVIKDIQNGETPFFYGLPK